MISLGKWKILTPLQKMPKNVGDLGQLVIAKGFKKLPKVQKIAKSGHTALSYNTCLCLRLSIYLSHSWFCKKIASYVINWLLPYNEKFEGSNTLPKALWKVQI